MAATLATGLFGTVLVGGQVVSLLSTVGTDFIIKSMTSTTSSICAVLAGFAYSDEPGMTKIKEDLDKIDLEHTVNVIEELVKEQECEEGKEAHTSVKKALVGVHIILEKIHEELNTIKEAIEYHKTKYLNDWRRFDCSCNIKTIQKHNETLERRYKMLVDLLKIYN